MSPAPLVGHGPVDQHCGAGQARAGVRWPRDDQVGGLPTTPGWPRRGHPVVRLVQLEDGVAAVGVHEEVVRAAEAVGQRFGALFGVELCAAARLPD